MIEHSPYSSERPISCLEFEISFLLDECPVRIRPVRTTRAATVHWTCDQCGHHESFNANPLWSTESLVIEGTTRASEHMIRLHPGPRTRAAWARIGRG